MSMYGRYKPGDKVWPATDFTGDKGFTVQADRDEADINKIVARFQKTGQLPPTLKGEPFYGDVSDFGDLAESLIKIQDADRLFMTFPADVRERFDNDKVKMIEFLEDPANYDEALKLGIVQPRPEVVVPDPGTVLDPSTVPIPTASISRDVDSPPYSKRVK